MDEIGELEQLASQARAKKGRMDADSRAKASSLVATIWGNPALDPKPTIELLESLQSELGPTLSGSKELHPCSSSNSMLVVAVRRHFTSISSKDTLECGLHPISCARQRRWQRKRHRIRDGAIASYAGLKGCNHVNDRTN